MVISEDRSMYDCMKLPWTAVLNIRQAALLQAEVFVSLGCARFIVCLLAAYLLFVDLEKS